jgi:hypothetical protein
MDLKRDVVKYVRDKAKHGYTKTGICEICGDTEGVDFHHFYSVTEMLNKWLTDNEIDILCAEDIIRVRDEFIVLHNTELYIEAANLCHKHHEQLHRLYGKRPALNTALKQKRWVEIQKDKYVDNKLVTTKT